MKQLKHSPSSRKAVASIVYHAAATPLLQAAMAIGSGRKYPRLLSNLSSVDSKKARPDTADSIAVSTRACRGRKMCGLWFRVCWY
jgi:hypothetical protein